MLADAGFLTITFSSGKHGIQRMCGATEQRLLIDPAQATRTFIDGGKRSDVTLEDINIHHATNLVLRVSAPKDAQNAGGLTLYGRRFGNYDQDIRVRMQYR